MIGNDAADEVGVGVPECRHQVTQLLLVQLTHSTEHALTGFECAMDGACHLIHADNTVHCEDVEKEEQPCLSVFYSIIKMSTCDIGAIMRNYSGSCCTVVLVICVAMKGL